MLTQFAQGLPDRCDNSTACRPKSTPTDCAFFYMPSKSRHGTHILLVHRLKANSHVLASMETIDACIWHMFVFMSVVVTVWGFEGMCVV